MKLLLDGLAKKHFVMFSFDSSTEAIRRHLRKTRAVTELLAALMNKSSLGLGDDVKRPLHTQPSPTVFGSC